MVELSDQDAVGKPRGCLATAVAAAVLALLTPFIAVIRGWRSWRRGTDVRTSLDVGPIEGINGPHRRRFDLAMDVPLAAEPDVRGRLTDTVVRVAEALRRDDDVYHLLYRLPWDDESMAIPVGPQIQEFGERFSLVQAQGAMNGRTAVWLTLARGRPLAEVVDPANCDPEREGEPDTLLCLREARWSLATAWTRSGPSLGLRMVFVVPTESAPRVAGLLERLL